jgi:hypothetical protein
VCLQTARHALLTAMVMAAMSATLACQPDAPDRTYGRVLPPVEAPTYQAEVEEGLGAAVAILIDTSGSMRDATPSDPRPKYLVARAAIEAMLDATDAFVAKRPEFPIKIAVYSFSSRARVLRRIEPYDRAAIRLALETVPQPGGGTAIGEALRVARPELYRAGVLRKYLLVVTDGENTSGRSPDEVTREIWTKSQGSVHVYFVAFDTSPEKFAFLKAAGGDVIGAATGPELQQALADIYQGKILAEAPDSGEREPGRK